jgi:sugar lactone lactonase YvrE
MRKIVGAITALILLPASLAAAEVVVINDQARFPEGPLVVGETLYYVEYGGHTIVTWDGKTNAVLWTQEGCGPSALVQLEGGDFLVTCYDSGSIARVSAKGETLANYDKDAAGGTLLGPNDLTLDRKGGAYFTASGPWESAPIVGHVYHIDGAGKIVSVADDLHYANGIELSHDGKTLYVIESEAARVIQFAVAEDGSLSDRRLFFRYSDIGMTHEGWGQPYPDGMKLDSQGNLFIGHYSAAQILVLSPEGKVLGEILVPSSASPNLAFSADEGTVYVMAVGDTTNPPYMGKVYAAKNPLK